MPETEEKKKYKSYPQTTRAVEGGSRKTGCGLAKAKDEKYRAEPHAKSEKK